MSSWADQFALPGLVTCAGMYQLATFARAAGSARMKYKVNPPDTTGSPEFNRIFRAQQNSVEFYPLSLTGLWISAVFFHPVPASLAYVGYLYARQGYFKGYAESSEKRIKPFKLSITFLKMLMFMSMAGVVHKTFRFYGNIDLWQLLKNAIPSLTN